MSRFHSSIVTPLLALALLGCATERPTRSGGHAALPSVPISTQLVLRSSEIIPGTKGADSVTTISFASVPWWDSVTHGDLHVSYQIVWRSASEGVFVVDPDSREWRIVEGGLTMQPGGCYGFGPCIAYGDRLLSQMFGCRPEAALDSTGSIRLAGQRVSGFKGRILEYDPSFAFRTILAGWTLGHSDDVSAILADTLWYLATFDDPATGLPVDSLFAFDLSGNRISSNWMPFHTRRAAAISPHGVWFIDDSNPPLTILKSRDGADLASFQCPDRASGEIYRSLTVRGDHLWYAVDSTNAYPRTVGSLEKVDILSSISTGRATISRRSSITPSIFSSLTTYRNGFLAFSNYGEGALVQIDSLGAVTESFVVPVAWSSTMATDDETVWITHHGPKGFLTDATLLTRFTLE